MEVWLLPFQLDFMRDAMLIAVLVAIPSALVSCFLVLKGWSLMGDAVSHAVLPGIVVAYMIGAPLILGAFVAGMISALATGWLAEHSRVKRDTLLGLVFAGMFALGLVLFLALEPGVALEHILFGNILGVSQGEIWQAAIIGGIATLVFAVKWPDFLLHAFDPNQARAVGLPVGWLHYGLLVLLTLTIVAGLSAVGIILVISLLIAPGAIAYLVTARFRTMLVVSVAVAVLASVGGVYVSFYIDSAPAPTIVVGLTLIFVVVFGSEQIRAKRVASADVDP